MSEKSWLKRVSEHSWEPELLISGLAIYATLQAPDLLIRALRYYEFNVQSGSGFLDDGLPQMICSVFIAASYLLTFTFILHFVIRAFWVGMIGLYSVYPEGIRYDKIPLGDLYKRFMRTKIGIRDKMPEAVDKVASSLFSISFAVVFIMVAVGFIYSLLFVFFNLTKNLIPGDIFDYYAMGLLGLLIVAAVSFVGRIIYLNRSSIRNDPETAKKFVRLNWRANSILLPGVFNAVTFIIYYFQSNVSSKKFGTIVAVMGLYFMSVIMVLIPKFAGVDLLDTRDYNRARSPVASMLSENYESEQYGDEYRMRAHIQDPVINRTLLPLFLPYHKRLDERFELVCEAEAPADSLSKGLRRAQINAENTACAEQYFTFVLDERDTLSVDLLFGDHPVTGQQGFRSFIPLPDSLSEGRHVLNIVTEPVTERDIELDEADRLQIFEEVIPFWYYREK